MGQAARKIDDLRLRYLSTVSIFQKEEKDDGRGSGRNGRKERDNDDDDDG